MCSIWVHQQRDRRFAHGPDRLADRGQRRVGAVHEGRVVVSRGLLKVLPSVDKHGCVSEAGLTGVNAPADGVFCRICVKVAGCRLTGSGRPPAFSGSALAPCAAGRTGDGSRRSLMPPACSPWTPWRWPGWHRIRPSQPIGGGQDGGGSFGAEQVQRPGQPSCPRHRDVSGGDPGRAAPQAELGLEPGMLAVAAVKAANASVEILQTS